MDPTLTLGIFVAAPIAGLVGSLFGLGGGIIIIPTLTIAFGLPLKEVIGASLVGVIATSLGGSTSYIEEGLVNIRLGVVLEPATTLGSIVGALIAIYLDQAIIASIFAIVLIYSAHYMHRRPARTVQVDGARSHPYLSERYIDPGTVKEVSYEVHHLPRSLAACFLVGNLSSMLGVGGGTLKVPIMNIWMGVPMRAATATSNFMIGVTALAGTVVYYVSGHISVDLAATVVLGAFIGATLGPRLSKEVASPSLRRYFAAILVAVAILMVIRSLGVMTGV